MESLALALHVAAGGLGLVAGPVAGLAGKRRGLHTRAGWAYQVSVAVLCGTTVVLVVADPRLWPFLLLAVPTQTAAAAAVVVRRRRRRGWLVIHVQLVLGSYVSFVTAFSVQTVGGTAGWLAPSAAGSVVVAVVTARVARRTPARVSAAA
ncbi:MAG TPA: hypothetical protein VNU26_18315 [Mycobacteriales bacterium]|nr:hypothetical protein [Mycobacteriales bacterium]